MATYIKRNNGKITARIRIKGHNLTETFDTKKEAKLWAEREEAEIKGGKTAITRGKTLKDALLRYINDVDLKKADKNLLKKISKQKIAEKLLMNITTDDMQSWIDWRGTSIKPNSVLRECSGLNPVFVRAMKVWKWIDMNPLTDTIKPREEEGRTRRCWPHEEKRILEGLFYSENEPINERCTLTAVAFLLALETGMRQGEIWGIDRKHINWTGRFVHLPETKNRRKRDVPLSSRAIELLRKLDHFDKPFGAYSQASCGALFSDTVKILGIEDFIFHDTRHEACFRLARPIDGVRDKLEILDLAKMIGHRDLNSLLIYYNPTPEEIADRLN